MQGITTHVLDTSRGRPAQGIPVRLERRGTGRDEWFLIGNGETNADGRVTNLMPATASITPGVYRLVFETRRYFGDNTLYPSIVILFETHANESHYHVPLLLSAFGYSTY